MNGGRSGYIIVGSFVLLMLGVFVAIMAKLAGSTGPTDTYFTEFNNVGGLKYGTLVLYEGFGIGQIESIKPSPDKDKLHFPSREKDKPHFRVEMSVRHDWQIPINSEAKIAASGLLSAVAINISAGDSQEMLPAKASMKGISPVDLFSSMSKIAGEFGDLNRTGLIPLIQGLHDTMNTLGALLVEKAPTVLANISAVTKDLAAKTPGITDSVTSFTANLNQSTGGENKAKIERTLANIERASQNFATLGADMEGTRQKLDAVLTVVNSTVTDNRKSIDGSAEDLRYTLSTLARHVDSVSQNLDGASRNMNEFSRELRENPALLLSGKPPVDEAPVRR